MCLYRSQLLLFWEQTLNPIIMWPAKLPFVIMLQQETRGMLNRCLKYGSGSHLTRTIWRTKK